jgi:putative ABC transport system permease protein
MTTRENIRVALSAIRGQMLRTVLTILIIAFGIMALVGILTSIDALKGSISTSFSNMGSNSFTIRNSGMNIHMGGKSKRAKRHSKITYYQALEFKDRYKYPSQISVSTMADQIGIIKYESLKSNPNITVMGIDPNYLDVSGYILSTGRNLTQHDLEEGLHVCLLGKELVDKLFVTKSGEVNPIDKIVSVGPAKYRVVGTLGEKGSSMGFGGDKVCLIPLTNAKQDYGSENATYSISVKLKQVTDLEPATGEATSMMRNVRKDKIGEDNSFEITQSDSLAGMVIESMSTVTLRATIIGIITRNWYPEITRCDSKNHPKTIFNGSRGNLSAGRYYGNTFRGTYRKPHFDSRRRGVHYSLGLDPFRCECLLCSWAGGRAISGDKGIEFRSD